MRGGEVSNTIHLSVDEGEGGCFRNAKYFTFRTQYLVFVDVLPNPPSSIFGWPPPTPPFNRTSLIDGPKSIQLERIYISLDIRYQDLNIRQEISPILECGGWGCLMWGLCPISPLPPHVRARPFLAHPPLPLHLTRRLWWTVPNPFIIVRDITSIRMWQVGLSGVTYLYTSYIILIS